MASAEAVAAVVEAGGAHVPGLMRALEERLADDRAARTGRRSASTPARRSPRAASGCGRCWSSSPPGRDPAGRDAALRAAVAVELVHSRDARPRRRAGRRRAAARPADGGRLRRPLDRDGHGRPAVLARVRRARRRRIGRAGARALGRVVRARAGRAAAARGRVEAADRRASATCAAAISRPRGCSARRASWARWPAAANVALLGEFGERIGLAFQLLDDVLDVSGPGRADRQAPRHRPARRHGHAAADPRARARPGAGASSTCARCGRRSRPRACATRSPRRARWKRPARRRWRWSPRRRRTCRPAGAVPAGRAGARGRRRRRPLLA